MSKFIISPSILAADFSCLGDQIRRIEESGVDWVHIDVMDGKFVPNITMGPFIVEACRKITKLPLDVHLMIEKPEQHIAAFAESGASSISVHVEGNPNIYRTLEEIRSLGCHPCIVVNPGTPACAISTLLPCVDMVLVMTVNPGFSGQKFIPGMLSKIAKIRTMLDNTNPQAMIQVDGGISPETLPQAYRAGARSFVVGNGIFKHPAGISASVEELRQVMD
jgi:ribulose-phosphate 3-epimerase